MLKMKTHKNARSSLTLMKVREEMGLVIQEVEEEDNEEEEPQPLSTEDTRVAMNKYAVECTPVPGIFSPFSLD